MNKSFLGSGVLAVALFASSSGALGQCVATGELANFGPGFTAGVAGLATTTNAAISAINTLNTIYMTQGSAFVGSPANPQSDQLGGGFWMRGVGGRALVDSTGVVGNAASGPVTSPTFPGVIFDPNRPISGNIRCDTRTRLDYVGFQAGQDIARLNGGQSGWNAHLGVTGGYAEAEARDRTGRAEGRFEVPFVGLYGAVSKGGFFADAQVRWDFYQGTGNNPDLGASSQRADARNFAVTVSTGYNFSYSGGFFIEPSAAFIYSRTKADAVNGVTALSVTVPGFPTLPATAGITAKTDDFDSLLGRVGVSIGTTISGQRVAVQPFMSASLWHEFAGAVRTNISGTGTAVFAPGVVPPTTFNSPFQATLTSSRIGTYGQFSLGAAAAVLNTGWLAYARVDLRKGENIEGIGLNAGIRYQFSPEKPSDGGRLRYAAEKAPGFAGPFYKGPALQPAYHWTGFYVGGHVGDAWGEARRAFVPGPAVVDPRGSGVLGGVQAGYNYQFGYWVAGVEADISWTNFNGNRSCPNQFQATCHTHVNRIATATGRLGWLPWDRVLLFAKGGAAWETGTEDATDNAGNITGIPNTVFSRIGDSRTGWTVGGGLEFGFTRDWSAKVEYDYLDFGTRRLTFVNNDPTIIETADIRRSIQMVKLGVNYHWAAGPLYTKY